MRRSTPTALASVALFVIAAGALTQAASAQSSPTEPALIAVPPAQCGPGSRPEPGMQGRVPAEAVEAGEAAEGYTCNIEVLGREGESGGYKVERYVDAAGRECAYYDTTLLFPANATNNSEDPTGVAVLDMSDPRKPVRTATLVTPAMQTPHESLLLNHERGLLAAVSGNPIFEPGVVDLYDLSQDCRHPVLRSSLPVGVLGHESGFAPDGNTFYTSSLGGGTLTAIDVSDPSRPRVLYVGNHDTHAVTISDDGNRAYLASGAGFPRNEVGVGAEVDGLVVLDVSEIQARKVNPQVREVGRLEWSNVTIPQAALPVTISGRPYLVEVDEFSTTEQMRITGNGPRVGAARVIDISDETAPRVVSNIRLDVHQPENRAEVDGDPGTDSATGGYAGHYCAVPNRNDPGIVACSFLASGLRVFDIRNPEQPREIAYFVAPVPDVESANAAFSSPAFVPERNEIWYSDGGRGFYALRVTNDAWPQTAPQVGPETAPSADKPGPRDAAGTPPPSTTGSVTAASARSLPSTGLEAPVALGVVLLAAAGVARRAASRGRTAA
jgi:hypothetical protein